MIYYVDCSSFFFKYMFLYKKKKQMILFEKLNIKFEND